MMTCGGGEVDSIVYIYTVTKLNTHSQTHYTLGKLHVSVLCWIQLESGTYNGNP